MSAAGHEYDEGECGEVNWDADPAEKMREYADRAV